MKPTETKIMLDEEDIGTLCICALSPELYAVPGHRNLSRTPADI